MNTSTIEAPEFVATCPDWCTLTARGLNHGEGADEHDNTIVVWHEQNLSESGDFAIVRFREDRLVDGAIVSTQGLRLVQPDDPDLTVDQLRLLARQAVLAADLIEAES